MHYNYLNRTDDFPPKFIFGLMRYFGERRQFTYFLGLQEQIWPEKADFNVIVGFYLSQQKREKI